MTKIEEMMNKINMDKTAKANGAVKEPKAKFGLIIKNAPVKKTWPADCTSAKLYDVTVDWNKITYKFNVKTQGHTVKVGHTFDIAPFVKNESDRTAKEIASYYSFLDLNEQLIPAFRELTIEDTDDFVKYLKEKRLGATVQVTMREKVCAGGVLRYYPSFELVKYAPKNEEDIDC